MHLLIHRSISDMANVIPSDKSLQLGVATNDAAIITKESIALMKTFGISPGELRGIGVQMQKLEPLKVRSEGLAENSQPRLQFKTGQSSKTVTNAQAPKTLEDAIKDDIKTPQKQQNTNTNQPSVPVEVVNSSTPSKRQINTLGTQFALPTQVDPSVLAELPDEIRSKLSKHLKSTETPLENDKAQDSDLKPASRSQSPHFTLPTQSQIDPSILEALPQDLRSEILGFYRAPKSKGGQAVLPQSPRKVRTLPPSKTLSKQSVRRKRGGGLFSGRLRSKIEDTTLTQANFAVRPPSRHLQDDSEGTAGTHQQTTDTEANDSDNERREPDPDFLAALPDNIREEILAEQRNEQLQRKGGIDLSMHQKKKSKARKKQDLDEDGEGPLDKILQLPPRMTSKPTFTSRRLSELPDLREAMTAWYREFSEDEGPYEEDVESLRNYLRDVVLEERYMGKAVAVVKWLGWVVEDGGERIGAGIKKAWNEALLSVKESVQDAVRERGLGRVDLG